MLDINSLSVILFENIFSYSVGCLNFGFGFLCSEKVCMFNLILFVFLLSFPFSLRWFKKFFAAIYANECSSCFPLGIL